MGCKVHITIECQVEDKDSKGQIIGMKWTQQQQARKNQLVRVVAKMTENCQAKINIEGKEKPGPQGQEKGTSGILLRNAPAAPASDKCTMYQERIFWAIEVHRAAGQDPPKAIFTASADCSECECGDTKKSDADSADQEFTDH